MWGAQLSAIYKTLECLHPLSAQSPSLSARFNGFGTHLHVLCMHSSIAVVGQSLFKYFLQFMFHVEVVERLEDKCILYFLLCWFSSSLSHSLPSISVPPERISIRDESNSERNSVVGPYSEGDTVKLKCDVFGGRPTPNVTWHRDGSPLSSETYLVPSGRHLRSEIVVERLSRQDLNSRFTCKAINHHRATPVEASVQLDMNCKLLLSSNLDVRWRSQLSLFSSITVAPLNIRLLGAHQHQPLSAGRRYDLLCQSAGSRPPAVITWFRDAERLDRTTETVRI